MAIDLTILAENDSGMDVLYVIAVLVLAGAGAIFEKIKQKSAEAQRNERGSVPPSVRPPVAPPVQRRSSTSFPSPVAPPPWSSVRPPATRPTSPPRPPQRAMPPQQQRQAPLPVRPRVPPEVGRPVSTSAAPRPQVVPAGVQQAVSELEQQVESMTRGPQGALQSAQSLAQIRARQQAQARLALGSAAFRKLTVADLRRAVVLNEILGSPLALREGE
jgi:hypothetical protein